MRSASRTATPILLLPFVLVALLTGLSQPYDFDEGDYHIPVIAQFAETLPTPDLIYYESATTPLMHVVLAGWGNLLGMEPWKLRLPVLLAGMLSVLVFYQIMREREDPWPVRMTLFLLAYPYAFWLSFLVMTEVFALLFGLLALRHFLRASAHGLEIRPDNGKSPQRLGGRRSDLAWFALWGSLAVLSRQQWLFLPIAAGLYWLWQDRNLRRAAWAAVPVLVFVPFFLAWGGTAPPLRWATSHDLGFNLVQIPHLLIVIGFYFAPAILTAPMPWRRMLPLVVVLSPLFLLAPQVETLPAGWALLPAQREFAGSLAQMSNLAAGFLPPALVHLGFLVLFILGAFIVTQAWFRRQQDRTLALWPPLALFALTLFTVGQAWERYLLPAIPLFILIFYAHQRPKRWWLNPWLILQLLLLAGFVWYQIA